MNSSLPLVSTSDAMFAIFLRALAILCAGLGLYYWIRLIGVHEGLTWRFDLMPIHWQVAAACLAVLYPFAACGLWMLASWGPVIWVICAAGEIAMYAGFPQMYGSHDMIVAVHAASACAYAGFRLHRLARRRRERFNHPL